MAETHPDLPLDDEIESHIDHGQVQVEPGDAQHEARELECGHDDTALLADAGL